MTHKKNIWITGGGSGIGKAVALRFATRGDRVVISGRDIHKLNSVVSEFEDKKLKSSDLLGEIIALRCDVSDDRTVRHTQETLRHTLGHIDIAVLSAGLCEYIDDNQLDINSFRRVFDVNVIGAVNSVNIVKPLMTRTGEASEPPQIVAVSSLSTATGLPRAEAYGASKAAVDYLFDTLTIDLAREAIAVTLIQPGFVTTPMTSENDFPMPFELDVEDAANRMVKAIDARKRIYRFPRRLYWLLKAVTAWPWLWYRVIAPKLVR